MYIAKCRIRFLLLTVVHPLHVLVLQHLHRVRFGPAGPVKQLLHQRHQVDGGGGSGGGGG